MDKFDNLTSSVLTRASPGNLIWYIDLATWCTYIIGQQKVFGCDIISNVIKRYEDKNCYYVSFLRNMHFFNVLPWPHD